jgi:hypothetical protein
MRSSQPSGCHRVQKVSIHDLTPLLAVCILCGGLAVGAQTPDATAARRLIGLWRLVDRTVTYADGTSRPDPRTTAYIFYSDTGITCYIAMDPARAPWKSETMPTPAEALAAITGLGAYCGTFRVDAKEGSVTHHMEIERIPNLVGRDRKRWFTFQDANHVILRVDPSEFTAPVVERRLLWERVPVRPELAGP